MRILYVHTNKDTRDYMMLYSHGEIPSWDLWKYLVVGLPWK